MALRLYKYVDSPSADQFHDEGIEFILKHAAKHSIELTEYKTRLEFMESQYNTVVARLDMIDQSRLYIDKTASLAGSMLNAQRGTKAWRTN
jgi:uncharacterized protein (DUF1778 family)